LKAIIRMSPQSMFIIIAVDSGSVRTGIRKVRATMSLDRKVAKVARHIAFWEL